MSYSPSSFIYPLLSEVFIINNASEMTLHSFTIPAESLKVGDHFRITVFGRYSANTTDTNTFRFKVAGTTIFNFSTIAGIVTDVPFKFDILLRCTATGVLGNFTGFAEGFSNTSIATILPDPTIAADTTGDVTVTITSQFSGTASPANTLRCSFGFVQV